jgi:hypothetical protein
VQRISSQVSDNPIVLTGKTVQVLQMKKSRLSTTLSFKGCIVSLLSFLETEQVRLKMLPLSYVRNNSMANSQNHVGEK